MEQDVFGLPERWSDRPQFSTRGGVYIPRSIGFALDEFVEVLVRSPEVDIALARVLREGTDFMARRLHNGSG